MKVVWSFETVTCTELAGVTWLVMMLPKALDMTLPGLLMGIAVVKVLSDWEMVTGTDKTGETPLDAPAAALETIPPGLVTGTFVVIVVSD